MIDLQIVCVYSSTWIDKWRMGEHWHQSKIVCHRSRHYFFLRISVALLLGSVCICLIS